MPISISRLRRWVAAVLVLICVALAGVYFYARKRVKNALREVPAKIGLQIQQSAQGFTISKSEQGRTLFKVQASKAIQFKAGGKAELHDVAITLYGTDASRFDQIYGKDFEYDPKSGDIISKSEVQIDLQSNSDGALTTDQSPPKVLKNPIHLRTTNLLFNKNTGNASTPDELDFSVPQASGSAVGASYVASAGVLTLQSDVKITTKGASQSNIFAQQAVIEKDPRQIVLQGARSESAERRGQADELTLLLRPDNTLDRAVATGHLQIQSSRSASPAKGGAPSAPSPMFVTAQKGEVIMKPENLVRTAVLTGDVHLRSEGAQPREAWAGRASMKFAGRNVITKVHADEQVRVLQVQNGAQESDGRPGSVQKNTQNLEVTAPAMDFFVAGGKRLARAETSGPPQVTLSPADSNSGQTHITADKFTATFDAAGQLSRVHGQDHAEVVSASPPHNGTAQPGRISTSNTIDGIFQPGSGLKSLTQQGNFAYRSGTQQAFAESGLYSPADQIIVLTGSPRIVDSGMETTALNVRLNRATGEGFAQGSVKTTYNDLKPQSGGALLASSDPIHVTSQSMVAHSNPASATYKGKARLWQNANVIEAPTIDFDKNQRSLIAKADATQKVSTVLIATNNSGNTTPVSVSAAHLVYRDSERQAHYEGGVTVHSSDLTITARQMDVYLAPAVAGADARRSINVKTQQSGGPAQLDKIVASGAVLITQPNRHATGDQLTYTASDDKFVLTGGPPSIFDAEHGKITGVSLTLFRHDDRVVVEGDSRSPAVTQTRMER